MIGTMLYYAYQDTLGNEVTRAGYYSLENEKV